MSTVIDNALLNLNNTSLVVPSKNILPGDRMNTRSNLPKELIYSTITDRSFNLSLAGARLKILAIPQSYKHHTRELIKENNESSSTIFQRFIQKNEDASIDIQIRFPIVRGRTPIIPRDSYKLSIVANIPLENFAIAYIYYMDGKYIRYGNFDIISPKSDDSIYTFSSALFAPGTGATTSLTDRVNTSNIRSGIRILSETERLRIQAYIDQYGSIVSVVRDNIVTDEERNLTFNFFRDILNKDVWLNNKKINRRTPVELAEYDEELLNGVELNDPTIDVTVSSEPGEPEETIQVVPRILDLFAISLMQAGINQSDWSFLSDNNITYTLYQGTVVNASVAN